MEHQLILSQLPLAELVGEIARAVRSEMEARTQAEPIPPEILLTREETAKLLGITLPTLRDYTRRGLVYGYRIGTRVRYKRNEVLDSLERIKSSKPPRT